MPYTDKEKQKEKNKEYQKKHYQSKKEYYKEKAHDRKSELKQIIDNLKSISVCSSCGEDHPACLDFHHLNPLEKKFNIGSYITHGYSINKLLEEIKKCIILCANCHRKLHYN